MGKRQSISIRNLLPIALLWVFTPIFSQELPIGQFVSPVDIPMYLSGNFGELRRNHFHTGIDIKTQGMQGKNILSVADGYVSRIKISASGYGRALYIDHPNGYTSVYAHLKIFNDSIENYIRERQYEQQTWQIEYYPQPGELEVKSGEIIALSGNSGSSQGPHLHFEIRETVSEHPINPLLLDFDIKDDIRPIIQGLRIYPLDELALVNGKQEAKSFTVSGSGGKFTTDQKVIEVCGSIGLGVHTYDKLNGAGNKNGIYQLSMSVNGTEYYSHTMDELDFETFRYVNTHKDYQLFKEKRWRYHKCFMSDNNRLEIYGPLVNQGELYVTEGETMEVVFTSTDADGNQSVLRTTLKGVACPAVAEYNEEAGTPFYAGADNVIREENFVLLVPQGALYDDLRLNHHYVEASGTDMSQRVQVHTNKVPLQEYMTVKMRVSKEFADSSKLVILDSGDRTYSLGGEYENGWVSAKTRAFGTYSVREDSMPPTIKPIEGLKPKSGKPNKITVRVSDNLAGIADVRVEIDGQWLLMQHNIAKSWNSGRLSDLELLAGEHVCRVIATDERGNVSEKEVLFNIR